MTLQRDEKEEVAHQIIRFGACFHGRIEYVHLSERQDFKRIFLWADGVVLKYSTCTNSVSRSFFQIRIKKQESWDTYRSSRTLSVLRSGISPVKALLSSHLHNNGRIRMNPKFHELKTMIHIF